jgi:hypothetical protein
MGFLIDDKKFINDNIFKYEERMNSQYSRFLDKNPTFVTYYHINNITSTTDNGFQNVERVLGAESPIRFKQINDFPVYGIEQIILELSEEDQGLDISFDSELIILPNTIQPLPDDFFTISYLDKNYLFRVTGVNYDTIKSNNYYKITFTAKSLTADGIANLQLQVEEKYNCIIRNIGTQEKCLIKEDDYANILKLNDVYAQLALQYKMLFFNKKYNSFIINIEDIELYDKYLTYFINEHKLFMERYDYNTTFLINEDSTNTFMIEYEKCFYRIIEKQKKILLPDSLLYSQGYVKNVNSIFHYYRDLRVKSVNFTSLDTIPYVNSDIIQRIKSGIKLETEGILTSILIDYFNNSITSIYNIDIEKLKSIDYIDYNLESFILIPVILYIIRYYYSKFMTIN